MRRSDDLDSSLLASEALVSGPSRSGGGQSCGSSFISISAQTASLPSSSSRDPQAVPSCLETLQQFARAEGFSSRVAAQVGLLITVLLTPTTKSSGPTTTGGAAPRDTPSLVPPFLRWLTFSSGCAILRNCQSPLSWATAPCCRQFFALSSLGSCRILS